MKIDLLAEHIHVNGFAKTHFDTEKIERKRLLGNGPWEKNFFEPFPQECR